MDTENIEIQENELLALESIYDERQYIGAQSGKGGQILVSIEVPEKFQMSYQVPQRRIPQMDENLNNCNNENLQIIQVKYLPPIILNFTYPPDYPSESAPLYTLSCKWLTYAQLIKLCEALDDIWNDRDFKGEIIFEWVQYISENVLELLEINSPFQILVIPRSGKVDSDTRAIQDIESVESLLQYILDYDMKESQYQFSINYFDCNVCFCEKVGSQCVQFPKCEHVYCKQCMSEYFRIQITDGSVRALTCPEEKCETQADPNLVKSLVEGEVYEKYERFLLQSTLECMGDISYCPRCQFPVIKEKSDNMGCCPNCDYIFCVLCKRGFHGVSKCPLKSEELQKIRGEYLNGTKEEREALEKKYGRKVLQRLIEEHYSEVWVETFAKKCPSCQTVIEKIDGCNKMTCFKCRKNFCWLCGKLLATADPYMHFNEPAAGCFNKLFEGVIEFDSDEEEEWINWQ